jgi:hypothetical protein
MSEAPALDGRAGRPLHELVGDAFEVEIVPLLDAVQYTPD